MYQKMKYQPNGKAVYRMNGWHKYIEPSKKIKRSNPVLDFISYGIALSGIVLFLSQFEPIVNFVMAFLP